MSTLLFLLFCLAVGYVCVWLLVNEKYGKATGIWGLIAMREVDGEREQDPNPKPPVTTRGWKP